MSIQIQDLLPLIPYQSSVTLGELARELGLHASERPALSTLLAQLKGYNLITEPTPERYERLKDHVKGTLWMHPRGFAFVSAENSDEGNLYVDPHELGGALHRDRVLLSLQTGPDGRARGRVEQVLERGTRTFVGVYREGVSASQSSDTDRTAYIYPQNERLPTQVPVERALAPIDGGRAPQDGDLVAALLVAPEDGANAQISARAVEQREREGRNARSEISAEGATARVLHVIEPDSAQGALEAVIYDQGLTLHLSSEVEAVAEAFPEQPSPAEIKRRKDLRHLPFVTIDPATAKDFDDAIYVQPLFDEERSQVRGWKLWVAIADVAHFVTEDSLLDKEAMERSATLYLPAQAFPMLPHRLSNDLCSLKPKVDRLAMVAEIEVSFQGDLERARFHEAIIHSQARFTYDQAASLIGALPPQELPKHLSRMSPQVEALRDCARALKRRRQRRGFLSLALAEPRLDFNERGMVDGFKVAPRHEAHEMVEEAMLAANESVAMHCIATSIPALYRIHAPPPDYGVERFEVQSALLGAPLGFLKPSKKGSAKGGGAKGKGGKEAPKLKKMKATDLSRYLKKHEDHPHLELLSSLLLRSMSKAIYEAEPALHFGLGTTTYLHFTSPIRRYPDLWVHRQLKLWLQAQQPHAKGAEGILKAPNMATLKAAAQRRPKKNADRANGRDTGTEPVLPSGVDPWEVAAYASRRERLIVDAERRVLDAYKALFMKEHVGERFEGFICNTSPRGVMVELNDYPIWCSVDQERLPTSFDYDEERFTWFDTRSKRTLTLGMNVAVTVVGVDVIEGKVEVALEGL